jgi:hypothetical protein
MLNVFMLSVGMQNVVMLNVVALFLWGRCSTVVSEKNKIPGSLPAQAKVKRKLFLASQRLHRNKLECLSQTH